MISGGNSSCGRLASATLPAFSADAPLDPFRLAAFANLLVLDFEQIHGLSAKTREHLLGNCVPKHGPAAPPRGRCPDGRKIVILNPSHGRLRTNATLMEEISHVFLGHRANRLHVVTEDEHGRTSARDYRKADEEAAYGTGAAALVPYSSLRRALLKGETSAQIAKHFRVSRELVEYRMKVTRLWHAYRSAHPPEVV